MRFYVKLILLIAVFVALSNSVTRGIASDCAYLVRVKYVFAFGTEEDFKRLLDETQRALAEETGSLRAYEFGKRWRALLDERLAEAARRNVRLTDRQIDILREQCIREAGEGRTSE